jgi:uncharacterized metal-binding protein YceD (DUF177 family)
MEDLFKIYIDRIKDGEDLELNEQVPPTFLAIDETDLVFAKPISIIGTVGIAGDQLVLQLQAHTEASLPCSICNDSVKFPVAIQDFYHMEQLSDIKYRIFDYSEPLRETILLNVPHFIECNDGNCPDRKMIGKYLSGSTQNGVEKDKTPESHYPFMNLSE